MPSCDKPNHSPYFHGALYQKMAEDLQLTGKAQRTVHGYLRAVRQLADALAVELLPQDDNSAVS